MKRLWMIKAPAKMKIILWRMAHDCLPTRMQLKHRHIPAPYACCFCGREETVEHALLMCQYASEVWRQVKEYGIKRNLRSFNSIRQWFFEFLAEASDEVLTILTITVWHIWEARNVVRNGESWVLVRRALLRRKYGGEKASRGLAGRRRDGAVL